MAILVGEEGSFLPSLIHNQANIGANATTKIEFNEAKILAGTVKKPKSLWVCSAAKKVNDAPACSKALQKKITKKATIKITPIRCFSILLNVLSEKMIKAINNTEAINK